MNNRYGTSVRLAAGHADVGHNQRMHSAAEFFERFDRVGGGFHLPSPAHKTGFERRAHAGVIVHHQDTVHAMAPAGFLPCERFTEWRGKVRVNAARRTRRAGRRLSVPPCCSTILRHTARPRPGTAGARAEAGIEDLRQMLGRNSRPGVGDDQHDRFRPDSEGSARPIRSSRLPASRAARSAPGSAAPVRGDDGPPEKKRRTRGSADSMHARLARQRQQKVARPTSSCRDRRARVPVRGRL